MGSKIVTQYNMIGDGVTIKGAGTVRDPFVVIMPDIPDTGVSAHSDLTGKNDETNIQHLTAAQVSALHDVQVADAETITGAGSVADPFVGKPLLIEISAEVGATNYNLVNYREVEITGTLPNGVTSTLVFPVFITGKVTSGVVHFFTGATLPTLAYSGGTVKWKDNYPIGLVINCKYTLYWERRSSSNSIYLAWGNWYV